MTTIIIHRKPFGARLLRGLVGRFSGGTPRRMHADKRRLRRPAILDLDDRMLSDIGVSRSEYMAAEIEG